MRDLGELLVERNLLSEEALKRASTAAMQNRLPLMTVLVEKNVVPESDILPVVGELQGLRFVRLDDVPIDDAAVRSVSAKLVVHYAVMPIRLENRVLTIAVSNPFDVSAVEDIETNLGFHVERVLACRNDILKTVRRYYGVGADTVEKILAESPLVESARVTEQAEDLEKMAVDASVVKLVHQLLHEAIKDRATDIHLEAYRDGVSVRRRIDGVLYDTPVPADIGLLYPAIVSRVKLMAGLDIVERRLPQDGRARVAIGAQQYDLRVSVVPAMHGEDVVIRILPTTMLFSLEQLGLSEKHLRILESLISEPHGIIFVTGPTGSGKTTTLYACLRKVNTRDRKIITIEDPIEYELQGVSQTQINPKVGLTFARSLRSMLRHDPDVMMVGEVRDAETAEIAIQAAMTGHLVLSTLHTNDAASGAVRLVDMGVDPYMITSTVRAFIAQRLVRVVCQACKVACESDGKAFWRGKGCKKCANTGYMGRIAICEFLRLSESICKLIYAKASASEILREAVGSGMMTLTQDGWDKVRQGITTPEEVLKETRAYE